MKKIIYFLICLLLFTSCNNIVLRKDESERVSFNNSLTKGNYDIYIYEVVYPETQNEKLVFMNNFENLLKSKNKSENKISFILPKNLYDDVISTINDGGIGDENSFIKSASSINNLDKININKKTRGIKVPEDTGDIQKYLNKQYYSLLKLLNRENEYNSNSYYTEFDKKKLSDEFLSKRKNLKKILLQNKDNFLIKLNNLKDLKNYRNDLIYLTNCNYSSLKNFLENEPTSISPLILINSDFYTGYTACKNSVILFNGYGREEMSYFIGYNFETTIIKIDNINDYYFTNSNKQIEISTLLNRKKYTPKRPLDKQ